MRILHTSDWHLGRNLEGRSRLPEQQAFIEELCSVVEEKNIDLILIAGDVFDTYNPPAEAEKLFYQALRKMAAGGKRAVVAVAGNHDSPDRLHAASPLARMQGIFLLGYPGEDPLGGDPSPGQEEGGGNPDGIKVVASGPGWLEISFPHLAYNAVVAALPYPSEQRLNEVLSHSLEEKDLREAYSKRVAQAFWQGAANFRHDTVNLAISHIFMMGGRPTDSERDISIGGAYLVEPQDLPQAHYIALGHLHRAQEIKGTNVPTWYSGSPLCYSLGEADQQKGVLLIEAKPGERARVEFILISAGKPIRLLEFSCYQEALEWTQDPGNQNCWVEMVIKSPEPLSGKHLEELKGAHPGIVHIRVLLPGMPLQEGGADLANLSLEEKFSLFVAQETGAAPSPELIKLFKELLAGGEEDEAGAA